MSAAYPFRRNLVAVKWGEAQAASRWAAEANHGYLLLHKKNAEEIE